MDLFYQELGATKSSRIPLAVMDMWKAFQKPAVKNAPQADMAYEKEAAAPASVMRLAGGSSKSKFLLGHVSAPTTERYLGCKHLARLPWYKMDNGALDRSRPGA